MVLGNQQENISLLQQNKEKGLRNIYDQFYPKVVLFCLKALKSKDLAEDVAAYTFVKIWEKRHSLADIKSFDAYLFTIARNKILDVLRQAASEERLKSQILASAIIASEDTENTIIANDYRRLIDQMIDELPPQRQKIFILSRIKGMDHEEIANQLGLSKNTVKAQIGKALKTLRERCQAADIDIAISSVLTISTLL